ncbi:hypothetical protein RMCBS344292_06685 [Rhizopus microsporus]|nr:hypothetical protein RMCBS344292_06685 [Rhizopus microsporus]
MHELKIHLENDMLIIRGSPEESVGCVLRGYVMLNTKETLRVKSIHLNLLGKMKIQWNERHQQQKKEITVIQHHWTFLSSQKKLHTLVPNTYIYPFELALPGNLAESIDSYSFGSLSYKLKATIERPAFLPNLIHRKQFWIIRHQPDQALFMEIPVQITNEWTDKLNYTITIPKKTFARGQDIPIDFSLTPIDTSLHVRYLSCFLKEYSTYDTHTESRIIRFFRDERFPSTGLHWHKVENMTVPCSPSAIQTDIDNTYFKIEHKLKFTMSLINDQGELFELRASLPVQIMDKAYDEDDELPSYENAWQSLLYNDRHLLSPPTSSPITPSSSPTMDYFTFQPDTICCRLPSYHTINLEDTCLPAYE